MSSYKLTYFNFRGRGEPIRLILHAAGVQFEDVRIDYANSWSKVKPSTPLGQVPIFEINGEVHPQHYAIARHLARQYDLAGRNALEQFHADIVTDICSEIMVYIVDMFYQKDDNKKCWEIRLENGVDCHTWGRGNEGLLNGGGDKSVTLTWADLVFYDYVETAFTFSDTGILDDFPLLRANRKKTEEHPKIKDYLQSRPPCPY